MSDSGSLQNLNDIVLPGPAPWWPPAPGWYLLTALLLAGLLYLAIRWWRGWRKNRYRRQALRELLAIRADAGGGQLEKLPALLKQAALAAWPREKVASLSGTTWHRFLDETANTGDFRAGAGATLDGLAYRVNSGSPPGPAERDRVLDASESWLKNHVRPQGGN